MLETWTSDDPRLQPLHPSKYTFHPIPPSSSSTAKWSVSILQTSQLRAPRHDFCSFANKDEMCVVPAMSFLLEREANDGGQAIIFDLGLRQDPEGFMPVTKPTLKRYTPIPHPHPISQLETGAYDLSRIKQVIISHKHFDHYGDLDTVRSIPNGTRYPEKEDSPWPSSWLKELNVLDLPSIDVKGIWTEGEVSRGGPGRGSVGSQGQVGSAGTRTGTGTGTEHGCQWEPVACFEYAVDWCGDGSLWLISAPGHCAGHMMALVRVTTSPDTCDSAHAQECYLPIPSSTSDYRAPRSVENGKPMMSEDPIQSQIDVGSLTRMTMEDNVMVLLAHETPAAEILPVWPDKIDDWKRKGWKEEKQQAVYELARAKGYEG